MLNRKTLKELSKIRLIEAKTLLDNNYYNGAYYLSGYIIELAIKACIAKKTSKYEFPDLETVRNSYTHDLKQLLKTASLWVQFDSDIKINSGLQINWSIVKDWSESSRYEKHTKQEAEDILSAVTDKNEGVLKWIKQYW